mgnify:CR=1 FL=1
MDIAITHRLSFKQARLTVLIGFILGTLLSLFQIAIDYASEDASIDREIRSLLQISHNPASRIAYNIDSELAQELTLGLLHSPAVVGARLSDNNNVLLAAVSRPVAQSPYRMVSDFLFGRSREFVDVLHLDHMPNEAIGTLSLDVDTFAFGSHFLQRAEITLLNGFVRSLAFAAILMGLFYLTLTKPLTGVIRALADYQCLIQDQMEQDNRVFARMLFQGRHVGSFLGVPPTGRQLAWQGAALFTFDGSLVADLWVLGDVDGLKAQLRPDGEEEA